MVEFTKNPPLYSAATICKAMRMLADNAELYADAAMQQPEGSEWASQQLPAIEETLESLELLRAALRRCRHAMRTNISGAR